MQYSATEKDPRAALITMTKRAKADYDAKQRAEEERLVQLGGTRKRWVVCACVCAWVWVV